MQYLPSVFTFSALSVWRRAMTLASASVPSVMLLLVPMISIASTLADHSQERGLARQALTHQSPGLYLFPPWQLAGSLAPQTVQVLFTSSQRTLVKKTRKSWGVEWTRSYSCLSSYQLSLCPFRVFSISFLGIACKLGLAHPPEEVGLMVLTQKGVWVEWTYTIMEEWTFRSKLSMGPRFLIW